MPGVQSRFQYNRGWSARTWIPARMMNAMKRRFRKCCTRSHAGKPALTVSSGRRDAGVPHEEILHRRQLSQRLSYRDADDGEHKTEWQGPQHVYPTPANPDLGHHANLGRQPVVQENTVVRRAEVRLDGIVCERNRLSTRQYLLSGWFLRWATLAAPLPAMRRSALGSKYTACNHPVIHRRRQTQNQHNEDQFRTLPSTLR